MRFLLLPTIAAALLCASPAFAQEFQQETEGWRVFGNRSEDTPPACFASFDFPGGARFAIVYDTREPESIYFTIENVGRRRFSSDEFTAVTVELDGVAFDVEGLGLRRGDGSGAMFQRPFAGDPFFAALIRARRLSARDARGALVSVELSGTAAAMATLARCVNSLSDRPDVAFPATG